MSVRLPTRKPPRRSAGLTLVELVIAIVVISVGVAGVLAAFSQAVRGSAQPFVAKQALAIAEALLEEVQLAGFTFCHSTDPQYAADPTFQAASAADCTAGFAEASGPEAGEARPFDNVNDYDGLNLAAITDVAGVAVPGTAGYTAAIAAVPTALNAIAAAESLQITVAVTAPNGETYALQGFRTRHSPNAMP
jgi:MSHA pilin protein MshD